MKVKVLFNKPTGVLFKYEKGYIFVPEDKFLIDAQKAYVLGHQEISDVIWSTIENIGRRFEVCQKSA